ncbi:SAPS-domain-containing protein [Backusella circina FSU 941]|nr:SAPS-domain-containing protein [Backusella circina FSU 941]
MFWRFGFNTPSAIDGLLDREDVTLEEVLCDQDIIQEAKSQNTKLIDFLLKPENLEELIELFFSLDSDRQRLSLIACEILSCEIPQLTDALVLEHKELLVKFWSFLDVPFSSDVGFAYQSSYFCKIITIFLSKDTVEMLDFIKSTPENLNKILCHLQSPAIMDLLISLVRLEELPEAKGIVKWLSDNGLLLNLINRLDPNLDNDEHATAQQCICEIVRLSQTSLLDSPSIGANDFILELTSKEMMQKLADFMLDPDAPNSTSTLIHGVAIIIDIIRHNNGDIENETGLVTVMSYQHQLARPPVVSLTDMLQVMTDSIQRFNNLLIAPRQKGPVMPATPLGFERLKICELFAELLHCSNMSNLNFTEEQEQKEETDGDRLKLKFVQEKVLPTCIDLFFEFPWNNFLHYVVYDMLHQVFNGRMDRESNRQLALSIFTQGHLTDKIVEAQKKNDEECAKPKGMRLGYMGHLTFISDEIIKLFEGYPESIISAVEDSINLENWNEYCNNQLRETKERDSMPLGDIRINGVNPIVHSNGEEDDDELDATNHALGMFSRIGTLVEEEEDNGEEDTEIEIESWIR